MTIHEKLDVIIANAGTGGGSVPSSIVFTIKLSGGTQANKGGYMSSSSVSGTVSYTLDLVNKTITKTANNFTIATTCYNMNDSSESRSSSATLTDTPTIIS